MQTFGNTIRDPDPFTVYHDSGAFRGLESFLSTRCGESSFDSGLFEVELERIRRCLEKLSYSIPGIGEYFSLNVSDYSLFYFSLVMSLVVKVVDRTIPVIEGDTVSDDLLYGIADFFQVPLNLRERSISLVKKFTRLYSYMDSSDSTNKVIMLFSESPEDLHVLKHYYFIIRKLGLGEDKTVEQVTDIFSEKFSYNGKDYFTSEVLIGEG